jgi:hypothetical protein
MISRQVLMTIVMVFGLISICSANAPIEIWNSVYDSEGVDEADGITIDNKGNVYVIGHLYDGVDRDCFTVKYDEDGKKVWSKIFDSAIYNDDVTYGVTIDNSGNVYVTGRSYDGVDSDYLTVKYSSEGNKIWNKTFDNRINDISYGIAVDNSENVYVSGFSDDGTLDWDSDSLNIIVKYNKDGDETWAKTISSRYGSVNRLAVDSSGNVYVAGTGKTYGNPEYYLTTKYDTEGNEIWNKSFVSENYNAADEIIVDNNGNVYVTGTSGFVKYDTDGNELWNKLFDISNCITHGISVDNSGNVYLAIYSSSYEFEGVNAIKYNAEGNEMWNVMFDVDNVGGVAVDDSGNIYVAQDLVYPEYRDDDVLTVKYAASDIKLLEEKDAEDPITEESPGFAGIVAITAISVLGIIVKIRK